jgi:hypothetical protein
MYVLALDESGTHAGAPVLLIGGIAVHEADIRPLEEALHAVVAGHLGPLGLSQPASAFEVHATDLKSPSRGKAARPPYPATAASPWLNVPAPVRLAVFTDVYSTLGTYQALDPQFPVKVLAGVVDRKGHRRQGPRQAESSAYDHVLHRFDEMLQRSATDARSVPQRGMVVHDRRDSVDARGNERRIQADAERWRRTGKRLDRLLQLPIFTDSRASRLVQAADLVAYALWRYYSAGDDGYAQHIWPLVDRTEKGELSGVLHATPGFAACPCPPCESRR